MEDPDNEVGRSQIGGNNGRRMGAVQGSLKIDATSIRTLSAELEKVGQVTKRLRTEMSLLADEAERYANAVGGAGAPSGGGKKLGTTSNVNPGMGDDLVARNMGAQGSGTRRVYGGAVAMGAIAGIAQTVGPFLGQAMGSLDNRIDRGIQYATAMDKLNLLSQQMTGMSQAQVIQGRRPLTNFMLGEGGINTMAAFQMSTGVAATPQYASGLEALRMTSGFSKSTQDILAEQRSLMDPNVANRMLYMLGTNVYDMKGGTKDPLQVYQDIVKNMGLNNPALLEGALRPGSVTRARMSQVGIGETMQESLIQYATMQTQFQQKGGTGWYDPTKESHLKTMGITPGSQLAIQQEETIRMQQSREEQFATRQIDNMAALERSNQSLIKIMTKLEDTMSGLIGGRISNRPSQALAGGVLGALGSGLMGIGALLGPTPMGFAAAGLGAAANIGGSFLNAGGDGIDPSNETAAPGGRATTLGKIFLAGSLSGGLKVDRRSATSNANDDNIQVPYGGGRVTLNELKTKTTFAKLHPTMQERLLAMMRTNPNVGLNNGWRSTAEQEAMFLDRYRPTGTPDNHDWHWAGQYWVKVKGHDAAPPGSSMHEIGLAADIAGDVNWASANAGAFGFKHFGSVNNEPFHLQLLELPNGRSEYEKDPAFGNIDDWPVEGDRLGGRTTNFEPGVAVAYGEDGAPTSDPVLGDAGSTERMVRSTTALSAFGFGSSAVSGYNYSINDQIAANLSAGMARLGTGSWMYDPGTGNLRHTKVSPSNDPTKTANVVTVGGGAALAAQAAFNAGFRGLDLVKIVAIAGRESNWTADALNPNGQDTGMWQINWKANGETARSLGATQQSDLYDPFLNAKVAFAIYNSAKGWAEGEDPGFHPWRGSESSSEPGLNGGPGWDRNGDEMWRTENYYDEAYSAVLAVDAAFASSQSGDGMAKPVRRNSFAPTTSRSGPSTLTTSITSAPVFNIAPTINFTGMPTTPDLRRIAESVTALIEEETRMIALRSA